MAERRLLSQLIPRWETLRVVADKKTAICRAKVRSEAHICSGVTPGSAPAGLASALRSASLFSLEDNLVSGQRKWQRAPVVCSGIRARRSTNASPRWNQPRLQRGAP
jgi:hypothetical protein